MADIDPSMIESVEVLKDALPHPFTVPVRVTG